MHSVTLRQPYFTPTKLASQETNGNCATLAFYLRDALYRLLHEQCESCSCCSTSLHIPNIVKRSNSLTLSNFFKFVFWYDIHKFTYRVCSLAYSLLPDFLTCDQFSLYYTLFNYFGYSVFLCIPCQ
jgi:hypothetical protein